MATTPTGKSPKPPTTRHRPAGVMGSVLKAVEVLEVFERKWRPLGVTELARETGQPKSSLHRVLSTLVHAGVLEQNEQGLYRLTLKLWRIGNLALSEVDLVQVAFPFLEALCRATDETIHLAVLEPGGGVVYLSKVESPRSIRVQTQVGRITPSWCTATGRMLLAHDAALRDRVLAGPMARLTPDTEIDPERLRHIIAKVADDGIAVTKGENNPEMGGIAAPIRDHTGAVVAALGLGVPAFRMDAALIERCSAQVVRTAADISRALNYRPADGTMA
ncbi:MAG: IclR family transcriptional regulator [Rhodospirillales bacterium]